MCGFLGGEVGVSRWDGSVCALMRLLTRTCAPLCGGTENENGKNRGLKVGRRLDGMVVSGTEDWAGNVSFYCRRQEKKGIVYVGLGNEDKLSCTNSSLSEEDGL